MEDKTTTSGEAIGGDDPKSAVLERPLVVNLGSARRKRIKELKRGSGKLMDKVKNAVQMVATDLSRETEGQKLLPVIVLYREKEGSRKKRRGGPDGICPVCCV